MLRPAYTPEQETGIQIQRFADDYFDLILEQGSDGKARAFHLCYNLITDEHALAWTKEGPLRHMKVDQGEDKATINRAPILVADGACPIETLTQEFKKRAGNLPPETQALILSKIRAACD